MDDVIYMVLIEITGMQFELSENIVDEFRLLNSFTERFCSVSILLYSLSTTSQPSKSVFLLVNLPGFRFKEGAIEVSELKIEMHLARESKVLFSSRSLPIPPFLFGFDGQVTDY